METQIADTLLGSPSDMARLHRRVVRVGAAAGWFSAVLFLVVALITGDTSYYAEAVGPVLAALLMSTQIVMGRENAGVALLGAALIVIAAYSLIGEDTTLFAATLAVVIIASIGMLFIRKRHVLVTLGMSILIFFVPMVWSVPTEEALALGSIMAVSFGLTSAIFYVVRNAATALNRRFQILFEHSPTAVIEMDWTEALKYAQTEFSGKPERVRGFLGAYPEIVSKASSMVTVVRANQAALDLLEVDSPEVLLGPIGIRSISEDWMSGLTEMLIALFQNESYMDYEFETRTFRRKRVWLSCRCVNVSDGDDADRVLVAIGDITHLKAKEDAMQELIEAKDEFVASISHELRTPLTAIVGLTSEMMNGDLDAAESGELIGLVSSQAEEMNHMISDLLVAARAGSGKLAVSLDKIDLLHEFDQAREGVGVYLNEMPDPELPMAIGDGPRVRQILRNLLTNVQRYGGETRRVIAGVDESHVWIEVRDNGDGVSDEDAARIFEPYASAHTGVSGSVGLGLSVARQLANLMGGTLTYRRDEDESVFRLSLALAGESLFV